jgi:DnaJ-domain-containing protein 1
MKNEMEDDFIEILREQEQILGNMQSTIHRWMDDLLRDALNPESVLRMAVSIGLDLTQISGIADPQKRHDPYRVLGLEKAATDEEVKKRYRELLKKLHPDTSGVVGTDSLLQILIVAYQQIAIERGWEK